MGSIWQDPARCGRLVSALRAWWPGICSWLPSSPPVPSVASRGLAQGRRSVQGTDGPKHNCVLQASKITSANCPITLKSGCGNSDWAQRAACGRPLSITQRSPQGCTHLDAVGHAGAVHAAGHVHCIAPDVVLRFAGPNHPSHYGADIEPCRGQK